MADTEGQHPLLLGSYGKAATVWRLPNDGSRRGNRERAALVAELLDEKVKRRARRPLEQIFNIAVEAGARCLVVEERYVDPDYRSEFSAFWSRRFEDHPSLARRLHFFDRELASSELFEAPAEASYLGYSVLRPMALGPVGRTVLAPPPRFAGAVLTVVHDRPSLFGTSLDVVGVPFCQQDGEFLVCAHTSAWIGHYVAQSRGIIGRHLSAEIASIPSAEGSKHRPYPSNGLTGEQLQAVFSMLGIPALFHDMRRLPPMPAPLRRRSQPLARLARRERREQILRVVCKYLNSGLPVVVLTEGNSGHAFTLVGWQAVGNRIRLIASDDQVGPYEVIDDPLERKDHRASWRSLMVPLPEKVFFTGEAAEVRARNLPELTSAELKRRGVPVPTELEQLVKGLRHLDGPISLRCRLIENRRYKELAGLQERSPEVVRLIRMAHLPHYVWVVEMQDRAARNAGERRCVLAEWVFDSNAHDDVPREHISSVPAVSIDSIEGAAGAPVERCVVRGHGRPWRSLITDREVDGREYALPAAVAGQA